MTDINDNDREEYRMGRYADAMRHRATEDSWIEYRRMIVSWHEDEVKARESFTKALDEINATLNTMKAERKVTAWVAGVLVPAVVALGSVGVAHAMGW